MNTFQSDTKSLWRDLEMESFPALSENMNADVTVIGSGITGITAAYSLVKKGYKVVMIEAGRLIEGTTGHTTAKITSQHGVNYDYFIDTFGEDNAKRYYEANEEALKYIESVIKEHNISCDFSRQDAYIYSTTDKGDETLQKEAKAYETLGIDGGLTDSIPLPFPVTSALKMNAQAHFHPVKYLLPLVAYLKENNTPIFENTRAVDIIKGEQPKVLTESGHSVTSKYVVMATHYPFKDFERGFFARQHIERSYSIAVKTTDIPEGMYINAEEPKRSIRYTMNEEGEKLLIIGGEGHPTGQHDNPLESYNKLYSYAEEHFGVSDVPYRWSSQDIMTLDMMPYIGPVNDKDTNIFMATGFAKWGMTNGTVASLIISDLISGNENRYADLFSPDRFHPGEDTKNALKENAKVGKEFFKGKFNRKDAELDELGRGEGALVQADKEKAGAYKDLDGNLNLVKPTCTHMGCDLAWNNAERSWDCPCHGSRFEPDGSVIEGPATKPLEKLDD
ncbi:FAD-dependent oxidoreductase [Salipaludibacillus sp. CUR1]|uniref:FAD-dependent oxidoreductase n=1 Tax=Salipaludibacillus sp. CUR1 TaxID=2820003 RepID=UPI001E506237|nr:FAD-dependent oxidoreductase [Salipaludibacillus sp. CUR1]MCE7792259.1 FAD-dependent oxidoreductase [Salipaludibacillus sp. CUR1]